MKLVATKNGIDAAIWEAKNATKCHKFATIIPIADAPYIKSDDGRSFPSGFAYKFGIYVSNNEPNGFTVRSLGKSCDDADAILFSLKKDRRGNLRPTKVRVIGMDI